MERPNDDAAGEGNGTMDFAQTFRMLLNEGRIQLHGVDLPSADDRPEAEAVLRDFETQYRLECPGEAPELSLPAAVWAAEMFYGASVILAYREIDEAGIEEILAPKFPGPRNASAHYSVDLVFRLLPELHTRAKAASNSDPLLKHIEKWANEWPLSSVGLSNVVPEPIDEILQNPSLRLMYVDRIIAKKDTSRLDSPEVQEAVKAAYGMHHQLAPEIHQTMTPKTEATPE
ncbi:MAG: hypothetical protein KDA84_19770 [Planctomycetaceae bacterium]|nr:hypothetical protein [Planctomycetaceae bacterium]